MSDDSYPTEGFSLPRVEGYHWELRDSGLKGRKTIGVWLAQDNYNYGSLVTCEYARPTRDSIEATARKVAENWRTYLHLKERVTLPQVRDETWELDPIGVGHGYVSLELGDLLSSRKRESEFAKLSYGSIERVARRIAKRRERYHKFIGQDFDLPKLPNGQQWKIDFRGGPLPYVIVNIAGSYRTSKIAGFTRRSVRKAAQSFPGVSSRNTEFFKRVAEHQA